jgi:glutathione S-transferase
VKLYYAEVLNPRKVCALARHVAAPIEFIAVALHKGEHLAPDFRALNPNGKVPVLQDGETIIWETDAIMVHLALHTGSDLWPRDHRQVDIIRWLSWNQAHFNRFAGQLYFEHVVKPMFGLGAPNADKVAEAMKSFRLFATVLDRHLADRTFLVGDALSVADFAVGGPMPFAKTALLPLDEFPAIARWSARLDALPAWASPYPARPAA